MRLTKAYCLIHTCFNHPKSMSDLMFASSRRVGDISFCRLLYWFSSMVESLMGITEAIVMAWFVYQDKNQELFGIRGYMAVRWLMGVARFYAHGWILMPARLNRDKADELVKTHLQGHRSNFYEALIICNIAMAVFVALSVRFILPVLLMSLEINQQHLFSSLVGLVALCELGSVVIWTVVLLSRLVASLTQNTEGRTMTRSWFYLAWTKHKKAVAYD
jgi:hypothetical protein